MTVATLSCSGEIAVGQGNQGGGDIWQIVSERPAGLTPSRTAGESSVVRLNRAAFETLMSQVPLEVNARTLAPVVLSLPLPDGSFARFRVADSPMLAPELATAFPRFRTYLGQGLDDPTATARFGWTDLGFHAIIVSSAGTTYIDPYAADNLEFHVAVNKASVPRLPFFCAVPASDAAGQRPINQFPITHGTSLRTYRLALAATGEYTTAAGGTKMQALSRIVATINRVNGIYERELAVRFTLATGTPADPTALIYTSGASDPYTNDDGSAMLGENQTNVDAVVGSANYDFGHVFSTGGGGIATLGSVCGSTIKARGVTGSSNPTGDGFDVDYVAHEMGHQFRGNHTFNGTSDNCSGNRSAAHAAEVGSGSTIQAYAGICDDENLQPNSDDYFTFESLNEMTFFITDGAGGSCGVASSTGNTVPTVNAGSSYTIPARTPFTLTASGSDADGDAVTYDWEQWSLNGQSTSSVSTASTDFGTNPIVRSYRPDTSPSRTFPKPTYILANGNVPPQTYACAIGTCLTGEILPTTSRSITFHVTARDNRAGGGAIATSSMILTTSAGAGPFVLTSPNTAVTIGGGTSATITWDVANTSAAPVSAANVRILLSTDGGATFPAVLAASTPNDGSQAVTLPNLSTSQARVRVEAVGNIFFDVSNVNFSITANTLSFTDNPLSSQSTPVKAIHITELRTAVDTLRARYGLAAFSWTDATLTVGVTPAKAVHVTDLRSALNAAYAAAGQTPPTYTTPTLTPGSTTITTAHIQELRAAVNLLW